jgi:ubiquitin-conjugating enzyme E2 variant
MNRPPAPALDEPTRLSLLSSFVAIGTALVLLAALARRVVMYVDVWRWWVPIVAIAGIAAADFLSGLVHWAADTWGDDDVPVIGPALLVPFRVHHVNPDDFLRRRFLDTNGSVAFVTLPVLAALFAVPLDTNWGQAVVLFGYPLCATGLMTNQIHQWAHMPSPPWPVRALQDCALLLGRERHAAHHAGVYDSHYCITTGWCNRVLDAIGFFRRAEALVEHFTGARPRLGDARYESRFGAAIGRGAQ